MKIQLTSLILFFTFSLSAQTLIPDSIFEQHLINSGYDNLHNGQVYTPNISGIDTLIISGYPDFEISDLSGIEDFYNLQYLDCSNNNIDTLNVNTNSTLKYLNCSGASISELIIDNLYSLSTLDFSFNNLTNVNLSGNPGLTHLNCVRNQLSNLNLSNNTFLASLSCGENILISLDLSMVDLEILQCQYNPITNIDLSGNYSLKHLTCHDNLLQQIDLSDNVNLEWLSIGNAELMPPTTNNSLTVLDISNNCNITNFYGNAIMNLNCIQICASSDTSNWVPLDSQQYFSLDCNYTSVDDISFNDDKLISIKDIYGREVNDNSTGVVFYIYQNGMVDKRIILDK
jgi:hypothetical protein